MSITLDAITLPDDLTWADEFDWTPTEQQRAFTLTGSQVVETGVRQAGRPITLAGGDDAGWIDRATLNAIYNKLSDNTAMTLTLHDARTFQVAFDHQQKPIAARPVIDYRTPDAADYYTLTLRFITL